MVPYAQLYKYGLYIPIPARALEKARQSPDGIYNWESMAAHGCGGKRLSYIGSRLSDAREGNYVYDYFVSSGSGRYWYNARIVHKGAICGVDEYIFRRPRIVPVALLGVALESADGIEVNNYGEVQAYGIKNGAAAAQYCM
jgi:hypothetical protein